MHKITFYPLGNADTCKIDLECDKNLLFDYAHSKEGETDDDPRIDLAKSLQEELKKEKKNYFDIVAFTHADDDHIRGSSDFFYLEHADKYQSSDRIRINELWVPAAMILEDGAEDEARILRQEARFRLKKGSGIRVFSRPDRLTDWLKKEGLTLDSRKSLITDAGQLVPGFDIVNHGVEFFVHSPFAKHADGAITDRNESALILHATFVVNTRETKFFIIGDSTHEVLSEVVQKTRKHKRENRLKWDVYDIPHHCSYLALSDDKGKETTVPVPEVKWLLDQGGLRGILISCSDPIPDNDKNDQPPHRQAANCYKSTAIQIMGEFKVTMENPSATSKKREPIVITIDQYGAAVKKENISAPYVATSRSTPRAGWNGR